MVKIETIPEGKKIFKLGERFQKGKVFQRKGRSFHIFRVMEDAPFIGAEKVIFCKELEEGRVITKEIRFF